MKAPSTAGKRITQKRIEQGITQASLAALCGVQSNTVSRWERDSVTPDDMNFSRLSTALNVSAEWLRTGQGKTTPPSYSRQLETLRLEHEKTRLENEKTRLENEESRKRLEAVQRELLESKKRLDAWIQQTDNIRQTTNEELSQLKQKTNEELRRLQNPEILVQQLREWFSARLERWPAQIVAVASLSMKLNMLNDEGLEQASKALSSLVASKEFTAALAAIDQLYKSERFRISVEVSVRNTEPENRPLSRKTGSH